MLTRIKQWLEPPHFDGDEEMTAQAKALNTLIINFGAGLLVFIFILVPFFAVQKIWGLILLIPMFVGLVIGRALVFRRQVRLGITLIILLSYVGFFSFALLSGGPDSPGMFFLSAVILIAGFFLSVRTANILVILTVLIPLGVIFLESQGLALPRIFVFKPVTGWLAFSIGLVFMNSAKNLILHNLENALAAARQQNTLLQNTELSLREGEARYRKLFDASPDGVVLIGSDGRIVHANSAQGRMYRYDSPSDLVGVYAPQLVASSSRDYSAQIMRRRFNGEDIPPIEYELVRKDGTTFYGETSATILRNADGTIQGYICVTHDTTERKRTETRNRIIAEVQDVLLRPCKLEDIYQLVSEKANQLIGDGITATSMVDEKRRVLRMGPYHGVNIPFEKVLPILGFDPWQKEFSLDEMTEEDLRMYRSGRLGILEGGLHTLMTGLVPKPACLLIEKLLHVQKIYGMGFVHNDEHLGSLVILARNDITPHVAAIEQIVSLATIAIERRRAEEALAESEKKYHELFQVNKDGIAIFLLNPHGPPSTFVEINDAAPAMLGYTREEMLKLTPVMLEPNVTREKFQIRQSEFESKGAANFETVLLHKNGNPVFTEFTSQVIQYEGQPAVMNIVRDITERKQHEDELHAIAILSAALRTAETRAEMLPVIVKQMAALLNCDSVSIEIIDQETGDAIVEGALGTWQLSVGSRQKNGTGMNAKISKTGQPYFTNNLANEMDLAYPDWAKSAGLNAGAGAPLIAQEKLIGFVWMGRRTDIAVSEVRLLASIADIAANALYRATLHEQTRKDATDLALAYDTTLEGWVHALELRDQETEGHTRRVIQLTVDIARVMGIREDELENVRRGALLHDIGKMGIPDSVLLKPGTLNEREWEIMRRHPEYAHQFLERIEYLHPSLDIPYCHHEKWDGSGYPRGLKGEDIPLAARIFAIVDVWDALTSDRPYRPAWLKEKALAHIAEQSNKHFDPAIVNVFLKIV